MKKLLIIILIIFLGGCYPTSLQQKANIPAINQQILNEEEITFITYDKREFQLIVEEMDTMQIKGLGKMRENNSSAWKKFEGAVPIDSIDLLYFSKTDYAKSLLINAAILTLIIKGVEAEEGPNPPTISIQYPSSGSSCPFVYSWQGNEYILEGEAFGIALGKAREMTTCIVLNELISIDNNLKVRITNERPETHFINNVSLHFTKVDSDAIVVADNYQELWPVYTIESPMTAIDGTGKNILAEIAVNDNVFWKNDQSTSTVFSDFSNVVELKFNHPITRSEGSLVIRAINTYFGNFVFERLFEFLGDQSLSFMQSIENDAEVIQLLEKWTIESSLKAEVWNGSAWQSCGFIFPEANVTPFSRLIRLEIPLLDEEIVKLRLSSLADVWKIDAVGIDWTEVSKIGKRNVPLKSIAGQYSGDDKKLILEKDDSYATLLPSQRIDLTFDKPQVSHGKKACYSLDVGGYLYEWLPEANYSNFFADLGNIFGNNRIDLVKYLLNNKNVLLPPLYSEWVIENKMLN